MRKSLSLSLAAVQLKSATLPHGIETQPIYNFSSRRLVFVGFGLSAIAVVGLSYRLSSSFNSMSLFLLIVSVLSLFFFVVFFWTYHNARKHELRSFVEEMRIWDGGERVLDVGCGSTCGAILIEAAKRLKQTAPKPSSSPSSPAASASSDTDSGLGFREQQDKDKFLKRNKTKASKGSVKGGGKEIAKGQGEGIIEKGRWTMKRCVGVDNFTEDTAAQTMLNVVKEGMDEVVEVMSIDIPRSTLPFPDHSFDVVMSGDGLNYRSDEECLKIVSEMVRVLKVGGQLAIIDTRYHRICDAVKKLQTGPGYRLRIHVQKPAYQWFLLLFSGRKIIADKNPSIQ